MGVGAPPAVADRRLRDADGIDGIFDELVRLRHRIAVNAGFDGSADRNLLAAGSSLPVGQTAQLQVTVSVTAPGSYTNSAVAGGDPPSGPGGRVTDEDRETVLQAAGEVEVLDGLAVGERVIISSIAEFEDYDTIQVVD